MNTQLKLHFGALGVIATGAVALIGMSPNVAMAEACGTPAIVTCGACFNSLAYCQSIAAPGCTAVSVQCPLYIACGPNDGICYYQ